MERLKLEGRELTIMTPKKVAEIVLCGALRFEILNTAQFIRPTEEQINNLKETFCIDVMLFDESALAEKGGAE